MHAESVAHQDASAECSPRWHYVIMNGSRGRVACRVWFSMATVTRHEERGSAAASLRIPWVSGSMMQVVCVRSSIATAMRHYYADAKSVGPGASLSIPQASGSTCQHGRGEWQHGAGKCGAGAGSVATVTRQT